MEEAVTRQHAHPSTVHHCLYAHLKLGYTRSYLAHVFNKTEHTIGNWLQTYYETGVFQSARTTRERKYTNQQRIWLFNCYQLYPLSYLDEAQDAFRRAHDTEISKISMWRIIHSFGLTWKVFERRAIHIKELDVCRFVEELSHLDWNHQNLVFLDEVSLDNRGMVRKRGYAVRGKNVAIRGDFDRKPRVLILAFLGVNGISDRFNSEDTFDRLEFTKCF
ncbi:Choline/Carnitine O-acyltransferase [Phytophthora cinnamomi]|uniref:Choline/Carnitine O-acyltransferase n=1 Tax=Phytophthora cinnamomi TaxID=4785 RepID=UPI00355A45A9|nr:Choline/Carnitine O-acyltransferase [Phytophthora cinnamomi]